MDDLQYGTRDKRGDWKPKNRIEIPPYWAWPPRIMAVLRWLPGYLFPWNAFHMATACAYWFFILPDFEVMKTLSWDWILWLLLVNMVAIGLLFGSIDFFYYFKRKQGTRFKFNAKFPSEQPSNVFWFKSQHIDNFIRTMFMSMPIWTAWQVFFLWMFANGFVPWVSFIDHPIYLALLMFFVPMISEVHFFCIHRFMHWPPFYKWVHAIHHNSVNPSPFSSLSMHPVESFLFFSVTCIYLIVPAHPFVALFQLHFTGFGSINGHIGFDRLEVTDETTINSEAYAHYLHHKYFEVNYGADGFVPLDKWFGTWHDGSKEGDALMKARFAKKKERLKAKQARKETKAGQSTS